MYGRGFVHFGLQLDPTGPEAVRAKPAPSLTGAGVEASSVSGPPGVQPEPVRPAGSRKVGGTQVIVGRPI